MNPILHLLIVGFILSCWEVCRAETDYFPEFDALKDKLNKLASKVSRPKTGPGCQSGNQTLGYEMKKGKSRKVRVNFVPEFSATPVVTTGLTHIDASNSDNVRIDTKVSGLNRFGFDLNLTSWDTSITWDMKLDWMACPRKINVSK